jgi:hypothetical protein
MARVAAVAWFPRTYINLFESYIGLEKVTLEVKDVDYPGKSLSFTISGFGGYPDIRFTQTWSGLHYFVVELPDDSVEAAADKFMKDMQILLLQKMLKVCHTVTYKNIVADMMPLDFHTIVLTKGQVKTEGMTVREAGDLEVAVRPQDMYYGGTISYVMGADDEALLDALLYHAYAEVGFDFIYNMMKAMIRLFHTADTIIDDIDAAGGVKELRGHLKALEGIVSECSSRSGKMKHVVSNFKMVEDELNARAFDGRQRALVGALGIADSFRQMRTDGAYMEILWGGIMEDKLRNINTMVDYRLRLRGQTDKKGWF